MTDKKHEHFEEDVVENKEEVSTVNEKPKKKVSAKAIGILILIVIVIVLGIIGFNKGSDLVHSLKGDVQMPVAAKEYKGQNYKAVKKELTKLGFDNITCTTEDTSLIQKVTKDKGEVKTVSIDGDSKFHKNDWFEKDDIVMIIYYK